MLSDRSWAMINRLVNHSRAGLPATLGSKERSDKAQGEENSKATSS
jgi:hypothetical protein